jgi:hypothetical protein
MFRADIINEVLEFATVSDGRERTTVQQARRDLSNSLKILVDYNKRWFGATYANESPTVWPILSQAMDDIILDTMYDDFGLWASHNTAYVADTSHGNMAITDAFMDWYSTWPHRRPYYDRLPQSLLSGSLAFVVDLWFHNNMQGQNDANGAFIRLPKEYC